MIDVGSKLACKKGAGFFEVLAVGNSMVTLQRLEAKHVFKHIGCETEHWWSAGDPIGKPIRRKVIDNNSGMVRIHPYTYAYLWDGETVHYISDNLD